MDIRIDSLQDNKIHTLLEEHIADMHATSPAESAHALDLSELQKPNITFWSVWEEDQLLGCGALKALDNKHAKIKSMRTTKNARNKGVASTLLSHILATAKEQQFLVISLETGPQEFFTPARKLYEKHGFDYCGPFADYQLGPHSVFMSKTL